MSGPTMCSLFLLVIALASVLARAPSQRAAWKGDLPGANIGAASRRASKAPKGAPSTRNVALTLPGLPPIRVNVLEVSDRMWWERESERPDANPYGAKVWPGSLAIAEYLARLPAEHVGALSVLELGCGNGLCSLAAASRGARVTATDISRVALGLTAKAATSSQLEMRIFDLGGAAPLPAGNAAPPRVVNPIPLHPE